MPDAKLEILLAARNTADAAFDRFNNKLTATGRGAAFLKTSLVGLAAGFTLDRVVRALDHVIDAASDMNETVSKVRTLFGGPQSAAIERWAEGAAEAMGLSSEAALDAMGTMGNMFLQLGAGAAQAADTSQKMVQLSADLVSFHNVAGGSEAVLRAMQAAFRGEYDALQRYIPTIKAASVQQEALSATGKKSAKDLTELEKAMAAVRIIIRDAGKATGDYGRTSGELANQLRTLDAHLDNIAARLGQGVVPGYSKVIGFTNDLIEKNAEFSKAIDSIHTGFGLVGNALSFIGEHTGPFLLLLKTLENSTAFGQLKGLLGVYKLLSPDTGWDERKGPRTIKINPDDIPVVKVAGTATEAFHGTNDEVQDLDRSLKDFFEDLDKESEVLTGSVVYRIKAADDALADFFDQMDRSENAIRQAQIDNAITFEFLDVDQAEADLKRLSNLTERTAEAMQSNFSDLSFDVVMGELDSFGDYFERFTRSIVRAWADMSGQLVAQGLFGKDFKGGGWLGDFGSLVSEFFSGDGFSAAAPGAWGKKGLVYDQGGIKWHGSGDILTSPTVFPLRNGSWVGGGEAGTEAIMPLKRTPSGDLGVQATGGGININITLQALDSRSGADYLLAHSSTIARALVDEMKHDPGLSKFIGGR